MTDPDSDIDALELGAQIYADGNEEVINWKGVNYYKACDVVVIEVLEDGGSSFCVKHSRHVDYLTDHEDYEGNTKPMEIEATQ